MEKKQITMIVIIVISVLLLLILIAGLIAGNVFYNIALSPTGNRDDVFNADHNQMERPKDKTLENTQHDESWKSATEWFKAAKVDENFITSYDDIKLQSLSVKNEGSNKWAILCHGYNSRNDWEPILPAYKFHGEGYNVLMPSARGHGNSEGDYIGMGWHDRLDIVEWINFIINNNPNAEIALYGVSMGGATVMMVSGENLPDNVKVIVEDCGYSSVLDEFKYQLKMIYKLPSFPIINFSSLVTKVRADWWLGDGDTVSQVANSKVPMMFIHGDSDTFVPSDMLEKVYEAANVPKKKLLVEGAGHGQSSSVLGDKYWDDMFKFVGEYID